MPTKKNGAILLRKSPLKISFDQLVFRAPNTEISLDPRFPGRKVFFTGVVKPGVMICKYTDMFGNLRYRLTQSSKCMNSVALSVFNQLKKTHGTNLEIAFIPMFGSKNRSAILKSLKEQHKEWSLDDHYEKLQPWLNGEISKKPPLELFTFRPVLIERAFGRRWSFLDYGKRSGVYILRKLIDGEKKVVHVGQSINRLSEVLRNHFYRNRHVSYYLDVHLGIYDVSIIEVLPSLFKKREVFLKKVTYLENFLKDQYLDGKDQLETLKEKSINLNLQKGYEPFYKEGGVPFPSF